jgi:hypothetical protein
MPIENRKLTPGTKLIARYKKENYHCELIEEEGKILFKLQDGREFKSPSAAGMAVTGKSCNGWSFWSVQNPEQNKRADAKAETPQNTPAEAVQEATDAETAKPKEQTEGARVVKTDAKPEVKKTGIYKMKDQKGAPEGLARYFCYDCAEPFNAPITEKHPACPGKHQNEK